MASTTTVLQPKTFEKDTPNATELMRKGKKDVLWNKYCGFLDLNADEFVARQEILLMQQIERLSGSVIGRHILGSDPPKNLQEFRKNIPFTTYKNYVKFLGEQNEDVLSEKPLIWGHTSGRSGEYNYKWIPWTHDMYKISGIAGLACLILSSCRKRGDVRLKEGDITLYSMAPPPYISGLMLESFAEEFNFSVYPSIERARNMELMERMQEGFKTAMDKGLDYFFGLSSILLKISESFSNRQKGKRSSLKGVNISRVLFRLGKAFLKSKLKGRAMLPADIWKVKGLLCGGTDTSIFKEEVTRAWGKTPLEAYASTEFGMIATQTWSYKGMVFFPETNFFEFMPFDEYNQMVGDPKYHPTTCLMNEVDADKEYVLVGTNFHGGVLVRYILGDLIKIISLEDRDAGVKLPQMEFVTRVDDVIDIGGFTRLTEKTIWKAIENSGIIYAEWTVRKEYRNEKPILHLYIELKETQEDVGVIKERIHTCLKEIDSPYREMEDMAGLKPLEVTVLSKGTFRRYFEERQAAGADLAQLKPSHINPSESIIRNILRMSAWNI